MKSKPIFLALAALLLITAFCACRSNTEDDTAIPAAQTETQPDKPETQEADIQPAGQAEETAEQSEDTADTQPEETEPEDELSEMEVTENIEIKINENQGTGGL